MTKPWLCRIRRINSYRVSTVRGEPGVEAALDSEYIWLRGNTLPDSLRRKLHGVADGEIFEIHDGTELIPLGNSVPTEILPDRQWRPLLEASSLLLPVASVPRGRVSRCQLSLVRTAAERPAEMLLCCFSDFVAWGLSESDVRLRSCRFAVTNGRNEFGKPNCLVSGATLPALNGQRFWLAGQVALPLGVDCYPAVDHTSLSRILALAHEVRISSGDILLWHRGENMESVCVVPGDSFHAASRQKLRRIQAELT